MKMGSRHRKKHQPAQQQNKVPHKFAVDERVLCYEPDQKKARVLYDSKVLQAVERTDDKGKIKVEYKIHFFGWNSSWDRYVDEDCVLKDTDENRELQKELKAKADVLIQSNTRSKKKRKKTITEILKEATKSKSGKSQEGNDDDSGKSSSETDGSDQDSSDDEGGKEPVQIILTDKMKAILEHDYYNICTRQMLVRLPAHVSVVCVFESYVKFLGFRELRRVLCAESTGGGGTSSVGGAIAKGANANAPASKQQNKPVCENLGEKLGQMYRKVKQAQETVYGLKTLFDFTLFQLLLYEEEDEQFTKTKDLRPVIPVINCSGILPQIAIPVPVTAIAGPSASRDRELMPPPPPPKGTMIKAKGKKCDQPAKSKSDDLPKAESVKQTSPGSETDGKDQMSGTEKKTLNTRKTKKVKKGSAISTKDETNQSEIQPKRKTSTAKDKAQETKIEAEACTPKPIEVRTNKKAQLMKSPTKITTDEMKGVGTEKEESTSKKPKRLSTNEPEPKAGTSKDLSVDAEKKEKSQEELVMKGKKSQAKRLTKQEPEGVCRSKVVNDFEQAVKNALIMMKDSKPKPGSLKSKLKVGVQKAEADKSKSLVVDKKEKNKDVGINREEEISKQLSSKSDGKVAVLGEETVEGNPKYVEQEQDAKKGVQKTEMKITEAETPRSETPSKKNEEDASKKAAREEQAAKKAAREAEARRIREAMKNVPQLELTARRVQAKASVNSTRASLPVPRIWFGRLNAYMKELQSWRMLPIDCYYKTQEPDPSMVYGLIHLLRFFMKLPEILNSMRIPMRKIRVVALHVNQIIEHIHGCYDFATISLYLPPKGLYEEDQTGYGVSADDKNQSGRPAAVADVRLGKGSYSTQKPPDDANSRVGLNLPKVVDVPVVEDGEHNLTVRLNVASKKKLRAGCSSQKEGTKDESNDETEATTKIILLQEENKVFNKVVVKKEKESTPSEPVLENPVSQERSKKTETNTKAPSPPVQPMARQVRKSAADAAFKNAHIFASQLILAPRSMSASRKQDANASSRKRRLSRDDSESTKKKNRRGVTSEGTKLEGHSEDNRAEALTDSRKETVPSISKSSQKPSPVGKHRRSNSFVETRGKGNSPTPTRSRNLSGPDRTSRSLVKDLGRRNSSPRAGSPPKKLPSPRITKSNSFTKESGPTKTPHKSASPSTSIGLRSRSDERQLRSKGCLVNALALPMHVGGSRSSSSGHAKEERSPKRKESSGKFFDTITDLSTPGKRDSSPTRNLRRNRRI